MLRPDLPYAVFDYFSVKFCGCAHVCTRRAGAELVISIGSWSSDDRAGCGVRGVHVYIYMGEACVYSADNLLGGERRMREMSCTQKFYGNLR